MAAVQQWWSSSLPETTATMTSLLPHLPLPTDTTTSTATASGSWSSISHPSALSEFGAIAAAEQVLKSIDQGAKKWQFNSRQEKAAEFHPKKAGQSVQQGNGTLDCEQKVSHSHSQRARIRRSLLQGQFKQQQHQQEIDYETSESAFYSQQQLPPTRMYNQHKNKKPVYVTINQQTVNGLLSLLLLSIVSVCGCIGAIFIMSALTVIESLQTRGNCYLVSLALAHLLVPLLVVPSSALQIMAGEGINARLLCHYQWLTLEFSLVVSQLSFLLIAADNYLGYKSSEKVRTAATSSGVESALAAAPQAEMAPTMTESQQQLEHKGERHVAPDLDDLVGDASEDVIQMALHQMNATRQYQQQQRQHQQPNATLPFANAVLSATSAVATGGLATSTTTATATSITSTTAAANAIAAEAATRDQTYLAAATQQEQRQQQQRPLMSKQSPVNETAGALAWLLALIKGRPVTLSVAAPFSSSAAAATTGALLPSGSLQVGPALALVPTPRNQKQPPSVAKLRLRVAPQFGAGAGIPSGQGDAKLERPGCLSYRNCCGRLKVLVWLLLVWLLALARTLHQHDSSYGPKFCSTPGAHVEQQSRHSAPHHLPAAAAIAATGQFLADQQQLSADQSTSTALSPATVATTAADEQFRQSGGSKVALPLLRTGRIVSERHELQEAPACDRDQLTRAALNSSENEPLYVGSFQEGWPLSWAGKGDEENSKLDYARPREQVNRLERLPCRRSRRAATISTSISTSIAATPANLLEQSTTKSSDSTAIAPAHTETDHHQYGRRKRLQRQHSNANQALLSGYTLGSSDSGGDYVVAGTSNNSGGLNALQLLRNQALLAGLEAQTNPPLAAAKRSGNNARMTTMIGGAKLAEQQQLARRLRRAGSKGRGSCGCSGCIKSGSSATTADLDGLLAFDLAGRAHNRAPNVAEVLQLQATTTTTTTTTSEFKTGGSKAVSPTAIGTTTPATRMTATSMSKSTVAALAEDELEAGPSENANSSSGSGGGQLARRWLKPDERVGDNEEHDYNEKKPSRERIEVVGGSASAFGASSGQQAVKSALMAPQAPATPEVKGNNFRIRCDSCYRNKLDGGGAGLSARTRLIEEYSPLLLLQRRCQRHNKAHRLSNSNDDCDSGKEKAAPIKPRKTPQVTTITAAREFNGGRSIRVGPNDDGKLIELSSSSGQKHGSSPSISSATVKTRSNKKREEHSTQASEPPLYLTLADERLSSSFGSSVGADIEEKRTRSDDIKLPLLTEVPIYTADRQMYLRRRRQSLVARQKRSQSAAKMSLKRQEEDNVASSFERLPFSSVALPSLVAGPYSSTEQTPELMAVEVASRAAKSVANLASTVELADSTYEAGGDVYAHALMNNNYHGDNNKAVGMQTVGRVAEEQASGSGVGGGGIAGGIFPDGHRQLSGINSNGSDNNNKMPTTNAGYQLKTTETFSDGGGQGLPEQQRQQFNKMSPSANVAAASTSNANQVGVSRVRQKPTVNQLILNNSTLVGSDGSESDRDHDQANARANVADANAVVVTVATTSDSMPLPSLEENQVNRPRFYWPILLGTVVGPSLASIILFARAYLRMKVFKMRPYKPMPLTALSSTMPSLLMPHSPLPLVAQQQIYTLPSKNATTIGRSSSNRITTTTTTTAAFPFPFSLAPTAATSSAANGTAFAGNTSCSSGANTVLAPVASQKMPQPADSSKAKKCDLEANEAFKMAENFEQQQPSNSSNCGIASAAPLQADRGGATAAALIELPAQHGQHQQYQEQQQHLPASVFSPFGSNEIEPPVGGNASNSKFLSEWPIKSSDNGLRLDHQCERSASQPIGGGAFFASQQQHSPKELMSSNSNTNNLQQQQLRHHQATSVPNSSAPVHDQQQQLQQNATFASSSPAPISPLPGPTLAQLQRHHLQVNQVMSAPIGYSFLLNHQPLEQQQQQQQRTQTAGLVSSNNAGNYGTTTANGSQLRCFGHAKPDDALGASYQNAAAAAAASLLLPPRTSPTGRAGSDSTHLAPRSNFAAYQDVSFSAPPSATFRRDHFSGEEIFAAAAAASTNVGSTHTTTDGSSANAAGERLTMANGELGAFAGSGDHRQQQQQQQQQQQHTGAAQQSPQQQEQASQLESASLHYEFRRRQHHAQSFHYGCGSMSRQYLQDANAAQMRQITAAPEFGGSIGKQQQQRMLPQFQQQDLQQFRQQQQLELASVGYMLNSGGGQIDSAATTTGLFGNGVLQSERQHLSQLDSSFEHQQQQQRQQHLLWRHRSLPRSSRLYQSETGQLQLVVGHDDHEHGQGGQGGQLDRHEAQAQYSRPMVTAPSEQVSNLFEQNQQLHQEHNLIAIGGRRLTNDDCEQALVALDCVATPVSLRQVSNSVANQSAVTANVNAELMSTALANVIKPMDVDSGSASASHSPASALHWTCDGASSTGAASESSRQQQQPQLQSQLQLPLHQQQPASQVVSGDEESLLPPPSLASASLVHQQQLNGSAIAGQNNSVSAKGEDKAILCTYYYMTDDQLLKSNIIVFILNLALWLPFILLSIASQYREHLTQELKDGVWWMATLNCCSCSYVYALTNKDFREAFNKLFYYCCCKSHVTFQRKTPIFRRQLDVDSKGNLRIHIIPGLNVYSNKLSKSGDSHMPGGGGGGGIGLGGSHHHHSHALADSSAEPHHHHHYFYHPLMGAHHHQYHHHHSYTSAASSGGGGHSSSGYYHDSHRSLASSTGGASSRHHHMSIGGGFGGPLFVSSKPSGYDYHQKQHQQQQRNHQQRSHHVGGGPSGYQQRQQRTGGSGTSRSPSGHHRYHSPEPSQV